MTKEVFVAGMMRLAAIFKEGAPGAGDLDAHYDMLEAIPDLDFPIVCDEIIKHRPYPTFPNPADFWGTYEDMTSSRAPKTDEDLRDKYSCRTCYDTPGLITYWITPEGRRSDVDGKDFRFAASPCPDCALGKQILEKVRSHGSSR